MSVKSGDITSKYFNVALIYISGLHPKVCKKKESIMSVAFSGFHRVTE